MGEEGEARAGQDKGLCKGQWGVRSAKSRAVGVKWGAAGVQSGLG